MVTVRLIHNGPNRIAVIREIRELASARGPGKQDGIVPIDPQKPPQPPPNCFFDEDGGLVCYPIDLSDKFK